MGFGMLILPVIICPVWEKARLNNNKKEAQFLLWVFISDCGEMTGGWI